MTEATWGNTKTPDINWRMSAALENVERGDAEVAEVTSLEGAVRAWTELSPEHQAAATLTSEHPIQIDVDPATTHFAGAAIGVLAELLP
jgi:hypothetical protein